MNSNSRHKNMYHSRRINSAFVFRNSFNQNDSIFFEKLNEIKRNKFRRALLKGTRQRLGGQGALDLNYMCNKIFEICILIFNEMREDWL